MVSPFELLREANREYPATRIVWPAIAIVAVLAIIESFRISWNVAALGAIVILVLLILFFIVSAIARILGRERQGFVILRLPVRNRMGLHPQHLRGVGAFALVVSFSDGRVHLQNSSRSVNRSLSPNPRSRPSRHRSSSRYHARKRLLLRLPGRGRRSMWRVSTPA
ncbi:hypothetical protein [Bradyrhizobium sp. BR 1433]|uniref:hypothetical protein n=1 Tax=Bradyrhizobium sp. BR 1433 TaxID=3447967 RepID=UPI003EE52F72